MSTEQRPIDYRSLILWPALITLGVTLLRLSGELLHWSDRFFSRKAGGAGALVGIVWLVPVFGIYFALRLLKRGFGPARLGPAFLWPLVGLLAFFAIAAGLAAVLRLPPVAQVLG